MTALRKWRIPMVRKIERLGELVVMVIMMGAFAVLGIVVSAIPIVLALLFVNWFLS